MISFVWSSKYPFYAGAGGSENYTAGQIRELMRRGIPTRILTIGHGTDDGREDFPDITFQALPSKEALSELDDTLVFVTYPLDVPTQRQSYAILHCPPPTFARGDKMYDRRAFKNKRLIATSKFAAKLWRNYLGSMGKISVAYAFAEADFAKVERPKADARQPLRVLFAGRLTPDKGIYTLMAALHMEQLQDIPLEITVTDAGKHTDEGKIILPLVQAHPTFNVVSACKNSQEMAKLMARHDVVVMPSTTIFWQEMFGIVSVEAQHAGCRVVASRSGGIPETNTGGVILVDADNPRTLARGLARAYALGPLTTIERRRAAKRFTVGESVDSLLKIIAADEQRGQKTAPLRLGEGLLSPFPAGQLSLIGDRLLPVAYPGARRPVGK